jgi:hypothetical protein
VENVYASYYDRDGSGPKNIVELEMNRHQPMSTPQSDMTIMIHSGPQSGESFTVPAGEVRTIGRTRASNIAIDDDHFMSSLHFEIQNCGDFAEVRDLNSTNKTWVNDVAIRNAKVGAVDEVRAGKTVFRVEWARSEDDVDGMSVPPLKDASTPLDSMDVSNLSSQTGEIPFLRLAPALDLFLQSPRHSGYSTVHNWNPLQMVSTPEETIHPSSRWTQPLNTTNPLTIFRPLIRIL